MSRGIYFSANDRVYNWTVGFLRSFRKYNPDLDLYWIPFNDDSDRVSALSSEYNFGTFMDPSFEELEKLGEAYELGHSAYGKYWFRRYAAFWGPLDHFMYLDARQLVLAGLDPVLKMVEGELDFAYYDLAIDQVYQPGQIRQDFCKRKLGRGFLSGLWASKRSTFTQAEMLALGYESLKRRTELNERNTDQAFINYCVDSKPQLKTAQIAEYLGGFIRHAWANQPGKIYRKNNAFYLWDYGGLDHKKQVMLLHWAGYRWTDALPQESLLNSFARPSIYTRLKRIMDFFKRRIKSSYLIRKLMGHV